MILENEGGPAGRPYGWLKDIIIGYFLGIPSAAEDGFQLLRE